MTDTPFTQQLDAFRQQIDTIDEELFQLILKRADIVGQVGTLKEQHDDTPVKLRPAREARQLRGIFDKFASSPFPEAAAIMIWRHLINGSLMIESPLRIVTLDAPQALPDYAREYFGCYASMDFWRAPRQLLQKLENDEADVGIFPMPDPADRDPWWLALAQPESRMRMFIEFPYLPTACVRDGTQALAISKVAGEAPQDGSHTALVFHIDASVAPLDLKSVVTSELPNVSWHCSNRLADDSVACFVTVPYVVQDDDKRLDSMRSQLSGENLMRVTGHLPVSLGANGAIA